MTRTEMMDRLRASAERRREREKDQSMGRAVDRLARQWAVQTFAKEYEEAKQHWCEFADDIAEDREPEKIGGIRWGRHTIWRRIAG